MSQGVDPSVSPEDELRAENALLKLKLELNHGMKFCQTSGLDPEAEQAWLRHIHEFEKQYDQRKRIKVYDFLKQPYFVRIDALDKNEISTALDQLLAVMEERGVSLDCCCEYDPAVIYRFITEELFDEEMDDVYVEGMVHGFTYEEFHPNHDYEIRRKASEFIEAVLGRKWNEKFDTFLLGYEIEFGGTIYLQEEISSIVQVFQDSFSSFKGINFRIDELNVEIASGQASLKGWLSFEATLPRGIQQTFYGDCSFDFVSDCDDWMISRFSLPGFG